MKLKNAMLLVVSGALAVLLSGCGAKDCPDDFLDQVTNARRTLNAETQGKSQEETKKMCLEKVAQFKKQDGCKLPEKNKQGKVMEYTDLKGNKMTHFSFTDAESSCDNL